MNTNIKDAMGAAAAALLIIAAIVGIWAANSYARSTDPASLRSFSVSGQGKVFAIPDVAEFTFTVLTQGGKDLGALQAKNTVKINKALDAVKAAGVADKDVQTQGYNVSPRYQYANCRSVPDAAGGSSSVCPPPEIVGYSIQQDVQVKVRDFLKVGDLLSQVVAAGANSVSQLTFTLDDPTAVQDQARHEAIQKAQASAQSIADAGHFGIGRLISIDENIPFTAYGYGENSAAAGLGRGSGAAFTPSIQPGSQEVDVTVNLRYEIR